MKRKQRIFAAAAALMLAVQSGAYYSYAAAEPKIESVNGENAAFISRFGKISYSGETYAAYKTLEAALDALGEVGGGTVYFGGEIAVDSAQLAAKLKNVTLKGIDKKAAGSVIDFGSAESFELCGDLKLDYCTIKTENGAPIHTNGYRFETVNGFDSYNKEVYHNANKTEISYPAPLIITAGNISDGRICAETVLDSGYYGAVVGGSYGGAATEAETHFLLSNGKYDEVYAGNNASGSVFGGNSYIRIDGGTVKKAVLGSDGGTTNANLQITVGDGAFIDELVIGGEAKVNGNLVLKLDGGKIASFKAAGEPAGKRILIDASENTEIPEEYFDYHVRSVGAEVEPLYSGTELLGFEISDVHGFIPSKVYANGTEILPANGIFTLPEGKVNIICESAAAVSPNTDAAYIAGYDGEIFAPQNNMTRAEAITMLSRLLCSDITVLPQIARCGYSDVPNGSWFYGPVAFFEKLGYLEKLESDTGKTINPNASITRAEFSELALNVISEMHGGQKFGIKFFDDVPEWHKNFDAISQLGYLGVIGGYEDGSFRPENLITRAEVVTIVNRFLSRIPTGGGKTGFNDISGHWAEGQILAACNAADEENPAWTKGTDIAASSYALPEGNTVVGENISALYKAAANSSEKYIIDGIDEIASRQIEKIVNAKSEYPSNGAFYYISPNGNNDNDGTTPETAWKTLAKLSKEETAALLKPGDTVLFERGGMWRGKLQCAAGVTYSAYGEGEKPIINGSKRNYGDEKFWKETDVNNVYYCTLSPKNVGHIFFNDTGKVDGTALIAGDKRIWNVDGFGGYQELKRDLEFYSDLVSGILYLYSEGGNPGERFSSIEIGEDATLVSVTDGVTIDNISFRFIGTHALGTGGKKNITVKNCTFDHIGGAILQGLWGRNDVRYGNALQVYGSCDGWNILDNWIYQVYDTGITHQYSSGANGETNVKMENIEYIGNVIEYCHWAIEWYNNDYAGQTHACRNVRIADNICRMTGYGWGSRGRVSGARAIESVGLPNEVENYVVENNIFDRSAGDLFNLPSGGDRKVIYKNNIYVQNVNGSLGRFAGTIYSAVKGSESLLEKAIGDSGAVMVFNNDTAFHNTIK